MTRHSTAQVTSEYELSLTMAALGGATKPALRSSPINRHIVASAIHRTKRKHRAAMSFSGGLLAQFECLGRVRGTAAPVDQHLRQSDLSVGQTGNRRACYRYAATFGQEAAEHQLGLCNAFG